MMWVLEGSAGSVVAPSAFTGIGNLPQVLWTTAI